MSNIRQKPFLLRCTVNVIAVTRKMLWKLSYVQYLDLLITNTAGTLDTTLLIALMFHAQYYGVTACEPTGCSRSPSGLLWGMPTPTLIREKKSFQAQTADTLHASYQAYNTD